MRILILGAGFGGLELAARLSEALGTDAEVTLIDKSDGFVFGFSKLDVMFGRISAEEAVHRYGDLDHLGVRFVHAEITAIDPVARRVTTEAASYEADVMVVALGADLHPEATPGLVEDGYEFYTVRRRVRGARCACRIQWWEGDRRRHVDAVQVPAGAERNGTARPRSTGRTWAAGIVGDIAGDADGCTHPAVPGRLGGTARRIPRAGNRLAAEPADRPA